VSAPSYKLHHVSVIVADTEKSLEFYCGILGLETCERPDMKFPGAWLKVDQCSQIHLLELPNPDPLEGRPNHGGRDRHMAMSVSDFDAIEAKLDAHNIPYTLSKSGRKALFCRDPDSNGIELIDE
jgi:glyoxylase I family protein